MFRKKQEDEEKYSVGRPKLADAKLKRDHVDNEYTANSVHFEVGKKVRNTIKELGGTMPENLPTPDKSLKELEKEKNVIISN